MLFLVLIATETALTVWHYLQARRRCGCSLGYARGPGGPAAATLLLFWRWFRPSQEEKERTEARARLTSEALQDELVESARQGVDVSAALEEIREQRRRRGSGQIYIAVYGEVSSGKSSLVQALLPEADVTTDPRAGTTTRIRHYAWQAPSGDRITIADLPGFNLDDDAAALEETPARAPGHLSL